MFSNPDRKAIWNSGWVTGQPPDWFNWSGGKQGSSPLSLLSSLLLFLLTLPTSNATLHSAKLLTSELSVDPQPSSPTSYLEVTRPIPLPKTKPCSTLVLQHDFGNTYSKPDVIALYEPPSHCPSTGLPSPSSSSGPPPAVAASLTASSVSGSMASSSSAAAPSSPMPLASSGLLTRTSPATPPFLPNPTPSPSTLATSSTRLTSVPTTSTSPSTSSSTPPPLPPLSC